MANARQNQSEGDQMITQIRRLSFALGAEIIGIDIRKPLDDKSFSEVHAAFLEYGVLLFRGQPLTREQHIALTRRFGEVEKNDTKYKPDSEHLGPAHADPERKYPDIVVNNPHPNIKRSDYEGNFWHTDGMTGCSPPMASLLRGIEVPEVGGDTMFANMYLAYQTLSDTMKKLIEGLYGIRPGTTRLKYKQPTPSIAHPLVRVHPETSRKSLYLSEKVSRIDGMTVEESEPLIQFLCNHAVRPQFVYRHRWRKDDLLIWDNRCLLHNAVGDYDSAQTRHMERTRVLGTPSGAYISGE